MTFDPRACFRLAGAAVFSALVAASSISFVRAEETPKASAHDHAGHAAAEGGDALSAASKEYEAAMQKMHKDMSLPYTNDVDVDFVRGMIPHHQGAIEQAQILLKHSKNPRLRRLAGGIIAAQKREIRFMKYWLEEHQKGVESGNMPNWLKSTPDPKGDGSSVGEDAEQ